MAEQAAPSPITPSDILQLKDEIAACWHKLPPEHQATQILVMLNQLLTSEYGPWTLSSIELLWKTHAQPDARLLPIPALSRTDLARTNLTPDEINQLTENDLKTITQAMLRHYANDVFWEELEYVAQLRLEQKRQK